METLWPGVSFILQSKNIFTIEKNSKLLPILEHYLLCTYDPLSENIRVMPRPPRAEAMVRVRPADLA